MQLLHSIGWIAGFVICCWLWIESLASGTLAGAFFSLIPSFFMAVCLISAIPGT